MLCLPACATNSPARPSAPPPPEIRCEQGATIDPTPPPEDWLRDGPAWVLSILAGWEEERRLRAIEHACLQQHRTNGAIR
jgi:hypothetical protein